MPYVGNIPAEKYAAFNVQHFTTSATTSYTLTHAVANELDIRLVLNNVVQQPGASYAYTASATTLTLSVATTGTDTMYAVYIGKAVQTVTPPDGSVSESKLQVSNSPTNGYVLSAQSAASGGLTWAADAAGTITAFTNGVDNRVVTATSATALNGEASLLFDGTKLGVGTTGAGAASTGKVSVSSGSGGTMPESVTAANSYVALGNNEYGASAAGKVMIALGYTGGAARTNAPAYIGYEEVLNSGYTKGNLTFYTRDVTTDTAPTKAMEINTAGIVTKPLQPAFLTVGASGAKPAIATQSNPFATVMTEIYDKNSDLSSSAIFTAPVTGTYVFYMHTKYDSADGDNFSHYFLASNRNSYFMNVKALDTVNAGSNTQWVSGSLSVDMDANDTMQIRTDWEATANRDRNTDPDWTYFSGYLLC